MKSDYVQITVLAAAWFIVAVINGLRDQKNNELAFWRRPLLLIAAWGMAVGSCLIALGIYWVASYVSNQGYEVFGAVIGTCSLLLAIVGFIGGFGCSIFIPWIDSWDIKNF